MLGPYGAAVSQRPLFLSSTAVAQVRAAHSLEKAVAADPVIRRPVICWRRTSTTWKTWPLGCLELAVRNRPEASTCARSSSRLATRIRRTAEELEHSLVGSRWRRPTAGWQRWRPRSPRRTMVRAAGCGTKLVLERLKDAGLFREAREGFEQWSAIHGHLPPARTEPPAERPRLVERGGRDQSAVEPTETMNAINGTPSTFDDWSRSWASCCTKRAKRSPRTTSPGSCRQRALKSFIDIHPTRWATARRPRRARPSATSC